MPDNQLPSLPSYNDMFEYILDSGKECKCCVCRSYCKGITQGPNGPIFPACSDKDFGELLSSRMVRRIYREDHDNA